MNTTHKLTTAVALIGVAAVFPRTARAEDWNCYTLAEACGNLPSGEIFFSPGYEDQCDEGTNTLYQFLSCGTEDPWAPQSYFVGEYLACGPCS